jgi:hypothetical protein
MLDTFSIRIILASPTSYSPYSYISPIVICAFEYVFINTDKNNLLHIKIYCVAHPSNITQCRQVFLFLFLSNEYCHNLQKKMNNQLKEGSKQGTEEETLSRNIRTKETAKGQVIF